MSLVRKHFDLDGTHFNCWAFITANNDVFCKLKELLDLLGYRHLTKAYNLIDDKWKFTWSQLVEQEGASLPPGCSNWHPNTIFVSESGIYYLMIRSKKPEAKRFRNHIFRVVLPAIRKYGGYISPNATPAQVHDLVQTYREQLLEKERALTETQGALVETQNMLLEKERTLTSTRGELTEVQKALAEARGKLEKTRSELAEVQTALAEDRGKLEESWLELEEVQSQLNVTRGKLEETQQKLEEAQGTLQETRGMLAQVMQEKRQLQNNMQTVRPKVAAIPDNDSLRHVLSVHKYRNKYKIIRTQKRSYQNALKNISEEYQLVYKVDNVPNALNIVNRLREKLPSSSFRYNTVTSNANVVDLTRECIEDEINRPIAQNTEE